MVNKPLTEQDFRSIDYWDIHISILELKEDFKSPLLCDKEKVQSAIEGLRAELAAELDREWINGKIDKWVPAFKKSEVSTDGKNEETAR
jgi:hypothetical protein